MQLMMWLIEQCRQFVRKLVEKVAVSFNKLTRGRVHPDAVTLVGTLMHIPIAILIAIGKYNLLAAVLLIIFGLFDTLDGSLARLQDRSSPAGMLLDASTDRIKEVFLYSGVGYFLAMSSTPTTAVLAVAACGMSICVSYVKAKGEAAVASGGSHIPHAQLNAMFKDGILTFELRMTLLVLGLLIGQLAIIVAIITVLSAYTVVQRLLRIRKALAYS